MKYFIKLSEFWKSRYVHLVSGIICGILFSASCGFFAAGTVQALYIVEFDAVYTLNYNGLKLGESKRSVRKLSPTMLEIEHIFEVSEVLGLMGMDSFFQKSRCVIDADGNIKPEEYAFSGKESVQVSLNWDAAEIRANNGRRWAMPDGAIYDWESWYASFMYGSLDELTKQRIHISEHDDLDAYRYGEVQDSSLDTESSKIKVRGIQMLKEDDRNRGFEIWVATDYLNLPVKIKRFTKDATFELVLVSISWV